MGLPPFTKKQKEWLKDKYPDLRFTSANKLVAGGSFNDCCFCCSSNNVAFTYRRFSGIFSFPKPPFSALKKVWSLGGDAYRYDLASSLPESQYFFEVFKPIEVYYALVFLSPLHFSLHEESLSKSSPFYGAAPYFFPLYYSEASFQRHLLGLYPDTLTHILFVFNRYPRSNGVHSPLGHIYKDCLENPIDSSVDLTPYSNLFLHSDLFTVNLEPIYAAVYSLLEKELNLKGV